jgi:hypothetical protein
MNISLADVRLPHGSHSDPVYGYGKGEMSEPVIQLVEYGYSRVRSLNEKKFG